MFLLVLIYILYTGQTFALENKNLALNMPASQSTSAFGTNATMANDGNRVMQFFPGTCSHTNLELAPWWTVDLMGDYSIHSLRIYNRDEQDCASELDLRCPDRLAGFKVHVSDEINATVPSTRFKHLCHADVDKPPVLAIIDVNCMSSVLGRYVTISLNLTSIGYLTLCEVEVYGTEGKYLEQSATTSSIVPNTLVTSVDWVKVTSGRVQESWIYYDAPTSTGIPEVTSSPTLSKYLTIESKLLLMFTTSRVGEQSCHERSRFAMSSATSSAISSATNLAASVATFSAIALSTTLAASSTTSPATSSATSSAAEKKNCCCSFHPQTSRISQTPDTFMSFLLNDLDIDKNSVTKERRKYISMPDDRTSSAAIGISFIAVILTLCGIILCDVKKMFQNVTEYRSLYT